jgi:hypothetical protein
MCLAPPLLGPLFPSHNDPLGALGHFARNGPAPAGDGAITMKNALASSMTTLPEQPHAYCSM